MIWHAHIRITLPDDLGVEQTTSLFEAERERAVQLFRSQHLLHIWRVTGELANISIWQADSLEELRGIHSALPLYPYMKITTTALEEHPVAALLGL